LKKPVHCLENTDFLVACMKLHDFLADFPKNRGPKSKNTNTSPKVQFLQLLQKSKNTSKNQSTKTVKAQKDAEKILKIEAQVLLRNRTPRPPTATQRTSTRGLTSNTTGCWNHKLCDFYARFQESHDTNTSITPANERSTKRFAVAEVTQSTGAQFRTTRLARQA